MTRIIDLHTHSTASDGSMRPYELVRYAKEKGLSAIALTDHDTIDGIEEALIEGERCGVEVIPGVEISVEFRPEMHMLGYFNKQSYLNLKPILTSLKQNREERNPKIIQKLNELGFDITMEEVKNTAGGLIIARPHVAKVMVNKGYVKDMQAAFDQYLTSGKPAYFSKDKLKPKEGIQEILKAGGVPVIAHPIYLGLEVSLLRALIGELKRAGLAGIEAHYVGNTPEDTRDLSSMAQQMGLLATGGSDFHGSFKSDIDIGRGRGKLVVPEAVLEELKKAVGF